MARAGNEATEVAVASSVRMAVAFPPKNLHISVTPDHPKVIYGDNDDYHPLHLNYCPDDDHHCHHHDHHQVGVQATLTCQAGPANPPPKLTWFIAGQQVPAKKIIITMVNVVISIIITVIMLVCSYSSKP